MNATRSTIESLAKQLKLPLPDPFSQDWEYEVADPARITDFLKVYDSGRLNPDEKSMLLNVILASYNDAIDEGSADPGDWELISRYLARDRAIHETAINYWALPDEINLENCFAITPLMRTLRGR